MDNYVYEDLRELQEKHWWFRARREIITQALSGLPLPSNCDILEVGCGTGGNLMMLDGFGNVHGMEMHQEAAQYARNSSGKDVRAGFLPDNIPFDAKFDLVCLLDVLEHIEDDDTAMSSLKNLLKPGGRIVITVPAYQWMFGKHDALLHHYRRYNRRNLGQLASANGFQMEKMCYFNTVMFPVTVLAYLIDRVASVDKCTGYDVPANWLNTTFYQLFRLERLVIDKLNLPYGSSLLFISKPID